MPEGEQHSSSRRVVAVAKRIFASDIDERATGFSRIVDSLSKRGLTAAGVIGTVVTLFYLFMHIVVMDYDMQWGYEGAEPDHLVLWDKILYVGLSAVALVASQTPFAERNSRSILGLLVFIAAIGMLVDDIASGLQSPYAVGYLTLTMFLAAGAIPFRPMQIMLMCLGILLAMVFGPDIVAPGHLEEATGLLRHVTFWIVASTLMVGVSSLVYRSRFDQYAVQEAIRDAERRVSDHARNLEVRTVELAEAVEKTERQARQLFSLEKLKSTFFASISHEFRTPITLILGPAKDEVERHIEDLPKSTVASLGLIERSGRRLMELVDQLLDLSRLEEGRMPLHVAPYDLATVLKRIIAAFESLAQSRGIELSFELNLDSDPVYFDQEQLGKIVDNLLSNAFKFAKDGGVIRLSATEGEDKDGKRFVQISVKDNGEGIPAEHLDLIFDRFHQVETSTAKHAIGTGIGLALVKDLVDMHQGSIEVQSELGFGSEFRVRLLRGSDHFEPSDLVDERHAPRELEPKGPWLGAAWASRGVDPAIESSESDIDSRPTVLVVDDHPDMLSYLVAILTDHYNVRTAPDGKVALDLVQALKPDLVITDVMMPVMDGNELCARIKADDELGHIPVVMLTAKATLESKLEALETGADDYILKPFDASELIARAENLIEIRKALSTRTPPDIRLEPGEVDEPSSDQIFLDRVAGIVEENLRDGGFTVERLAGEVGISRRQLERKLRAMTRLTPLGYFRLMRLKRAAQLLEKRIGNVSEVAYRVGFSDPNYFSRLFRQTFGVAPSEYAQTLPGEEDPG
jgi:signal transduction histidine kinase/DNA-binding response OmpR family regulator